MHPDSEVEPHLAAHLTYLMQRNQRPMSIRERRLVVLRMARRLGHPLAEATREELKAWQLDPSVNAGRQLKIGSVHNGIVHIAQYCNWLVVNEIRIDDPSKALVRPQHIHSPTPKPMREDDVLRALTGAPEPVRTWILLAANCGLRCMEIADLHHDWIVTDPPTLNIFGKGGKERVVSIAPELIGHLLTGPFERSGHLFVRMDGKPGPPSAARVSERVNDYLHEMGIKKTAHTLRHRFGTKLYQQETDMLLVAEQMGHASIETTRGYVRLMSERAASAVNAIYLSA